MDYFVASKSNTVATDRFDSLHLRSETQRSENEVIGKHNDQVL